MNSMVGSAANDQWKKPRLFSRILRRFSRVDDAPKRDRWKKGFKLLKKSNRVEEEGENSLKEDDLEKREQGVRFTNLIEQVLEMNQPMDELEDVDLSKCQCAEILSSVFPQLVNHWRAAGNSLKTFRYLSESGAAALAKSSNMQAIAYLTEARSFFDEKIPGGQALATKEEKARVESLTGQALFHMSRLDEALKHLLRALRYLGDKLPTSNLGVRMRIRRETIRHYLYVFLEGYFIGRAG